MNFAERINLLLCPKPEGKIRVLDLFAGCGGLALGFESQGFDTLGYEQDADACETYRRNLKGDCKHVTLTTETTFQKADVIIGGPPCQPFSVGGHQLGLKDSRDRFTPDIKGTFRRERVMLPNQNVLFELGYFFTAVKPECIALIKYGDVMIPGDLDGYTHIPGSKSFVPKRFVKAGKATKSEFSKWVSDL